MRLGAKKLRSTSLPNGQRRETARGPVVRRETLDEIGIAQRVVKHWGDEPEKRMAKCAHLLVTESPS